MCPQQHRTCLYASIRLSAVIRRQSRTRAVATMSWSVGSRWKVSGSCVESIAISVVIAMTRTPG